MKKLFFVLILSLCFMSVGCVYYPYHGSVHTYHHYRHLPPPSPPIIHKHYYHKHTYHRHSYNNYHYW